MVRITVSGLPGSGTSTLVQGICQVKGWSALNGGDVFREEAANRGLSVADFSQLCKSRLLLKARREIHLLLMIQV